MKIEQRHFTESEETHKGHMQKNPSGFRSTRLNLVEYEDDEEEDKENFRRKNRDTYS